VLSHNVLGAIASKSTTLPLIHVKLKGNQIRIPSALAIFSLLYWIFDRWAWHLPGIRWWVGLPDVRGEWQGRFVASNESGVGGGTVYLAIRQQWRRLSVDFASRLDEPAPDGSARVALSSSTMASLTGRDPSTLRYEYSLDEDSSIHPHQGVAHLDIYESPAILRGTYYTDKEGDPQHYWNLEGFKRVRRRPRPMGVIRQELEAPATTPIPAAE
jgi:hypothetical protein